MARAHSLGLFPSHAAAWRAQRATSRRAEDKGRRTEVVPLSLPAASLQIRAAFFGSVTNSAPGSIPTIGRQAPHERHGKQTHRW